MTPAPAKDKPMTVATLPGIGVSVRRPPQIKSDFLVRDFSQVNGGGWAVLHAATHCEIDLCRVSAAEEAHYLGEGWFGVQCRYSFAMYPEAAEFAHRARFTVPVEIRRCACVELREQSLTAQYRFMTRLEEAGA